MTNEEKAKEIAKGFIGVNLTQEEIARHAALEMAEWKDEQQKKACEECKQLTKEQISIILGGLIETNVVGSEKDEIR